MIPLRRITLIGHMHPYACTSYFGGHVSGEFACWLFVPAWYRHLCEEATSHHSAVGSQPVLTWVTAMRLLPATSRGASSVPVSTLRAQSSWRSPSVRIESMISIAVCDHAASHTTQPALTSVRV